MQPADPLLQEAVDFLLAKGIDLAADVLDGASVYVVDGAVLPTGELIAKAVMLGMMGHGTVQ